MVCAGWDCLLGRDWEYSERPSSMEYMKSSVNTLSRESHELDR
jgi:hypothetical protein